jgi:thiamine biosynthesis lipoprotein
MAHELHEALRAHSFKATGTVWKITIWDEMTLYRFAEICKQIEEYCETFEALYSRFRATSLVSQMHTRTGVVEVPTAFTDMLQWYFLLYIPTHKKINPAIGVALTDAGYDAQMSMLEKHTRRPVPDLFSAVRIIDPTHIELREPVMFDFGALGKGYLVDRCADILKQEGIKRFLVDGSGDLYYSQAGGEQITVGLEHPWDETKLIGMAPLLKGSICGSGINRRRWAEGKYHHYIDPHTHTSPQDIVAVWVAAATAVAADAIASCLFFVHPSAVAHTPFEYCIINKDMKVKHSPGFAVTLY